MSSDSVTVSQSTAKDVEASSNRIEDASSPEPPLPLIQQKHLIPGYPALAGKMGQYLQMCIVRGFWSLAARDLLYYQAELSTLELELVKLEQCDGRNPLEEQGEFAGSWRKLSRATGAKSEQWEKIQEIRKVLKEYHEAIIRTSTVAALDKPRAYNIEYLQEYLLEHPEMGPNALCGYDCFTYGSKKQLDKFAPDLISITPNLHRDPFSTWFVHKAMNLYMKTWCHRRRKPDKITGEIVYKQKSLLRITRLITCVVAAIPGMIVTAILSYVSSLKLKLIIMVTVNFLLAVCISAFTRATRVDVFVITSGFDAVAVVFLGQSQNCCNGGASEGQSH